MDGQGFLKDEAIEKTLILTNVAIIHFHHKDHNVPKIVEELNKKVKMIRKFDIKDNKTKIILIIRDSTETKIIDDITELYENFQ